jgi:hypothetical protein
MFSCDGVAARGDRHALGAVGCCRSPGVEFARPPQIRVDARLPTLASLAIGLHGIFIEPQRDRASWDDVK